MKQQIKTHTEFHKKYPSGRYSLARLTHEVEIAYAIMQGLHRADNSPNHVVRTRVRNLYEMHAAVNSMMPCIVSRPESWLSDIVMDAAAYYVDNPNLFTWPNLVIRIN